MPRMIFVNLPVTNLPRSKAFYEALGFKSEPKFTNDQAACMVWSETIHVMLLRHDFWSTFTSKTIPDAAASAQVLLCLSFDSREEVDAVADAASRSGGSADEKKPDQDLGFMYSRSFEDPDGHIWEPMWMDPAAAEHGPPAEAMA